MQLTTDRLRLREFGKDDWSAVLAYQRDRRYLRFYEWSDRSAAEVRAFVQTFLDQQRERPRRKFQLAIVLRETGQLIGNCGLRIEEQQAHAAHIGYELSPDQWGHGYATEAARAMVAYGFSEFGLHRIWSWCIAENVASARVLERLGMRLECRLRENEFFKDRWWDTLLYAILDSEWQA